MVLNGIIWKIDINMVRPNKFKTMKLKAKELGEKTVPHM